MDRWPNQIRAREETATAIAAGSKKICVTSPTGTGKSRMMTDEIEVATSSGLGSSLLTFRKMLFDQTARTLKDAGIECGFRADGYKADDSIAVQLCMTPTEISRVYKSCEWELHGSRMLIDEAHAQKGDWVKRIINDYVAAGGVVIGYTATPLGIGDLYDELIVAGTVSDGRACGALVPAITYAPDEPDLQFVRKYKLPPGKDLSEAQNSEVIMRPGVCDRVRHNWEKLNPDRLPSLLFGPDVAGSRFFAEEFCEHDIPAAHIDGNRIWHEGEWHESKHDRREEIARLSLQGHLPMVCNRFVLREGIDWPWLRHGIFATVFGALSSFLQSGGRLLRKSDGKDSVIVQDHGGNYWRHGSLNSNREWSIDGTNSKAAALRFERLRGKLEDEPIVCPRCHAMRLKGAECLKCGFCTQGKRSRLVVNEHGTIRHMHGDLFKPRKVSMETDTEKLWSQTYWRCRKGKRPMTMSQARGLFHNEHGYWPPDNLPLMPRNASDWSRRILDIPMGDLIQRQKAKTA